jgi:hypothetical protein
MILRGLVHGQRLCQIHRLLKTANSAARRLTSRVSTAAHRGRIQVQGRDLEGSPSFPWACPTPIPKTDAIRGLHSLKSGCTRTQLALRDEAFVRAEKFINSGPIDSNNTPIHKTFHNKNLPGGNRDARVDIEVLRGSAFV